MGRFCIQGSSMLQKGFCTYQYVHFRICINVAEGRSVENILFERFVSQGGRH